MRELYKTLKDIKEKNTEFNIHCLYIERLNAIES